MVRRFHYDAVCASDGPAFFVCATNLHTGKTRVLSGEDITTDAILASACLPALFQAVEIGGEAYWEAGYTGIPALFPLFDSALPDDIVIVNINPLERDDVPTDAPGILNRINEISFNTSLLRELRAISFVQRLLRDGKIDEGAMKDVKVHLIADDALMSELGIATKLVPTQSVISALKEAGQRAADVFLSDHRDVIGKWSSTDLAERYG